MRSPDGGLAAMAYAPCKVDIPVRGNPVKIEVKTDYPFRDTVEIEVTVAAPLTFPLYLRTPAWTNEVEVTAPGLELGAVRAPASLPATTIKTKEEGGFLKLRGRWAGTRTVLLRLPMAVRLYNGYQDAVAVTRGPLVYALKIGSQWKKVKDNARFADWEVYPTTPWNYALEMDRDHPDRSVSFEERPLGTSPFSPEGAPVIAHVKGRRYDPWKLKGAAAPPPQSPVSSAAAIEDLTLIPYGCTDLRMHRVPTLGKHGRRCPDLTCRLEQCES